ncbi:ribonuclease H-like domain-containing protein [Tanacetum coccineum]
MLEFCREKGIKQEFSNARTPQQNGVAERMNRTLIEAARTMLADSHLCDTPKIWSQRKGNNGTEEAEELLVVSSTSRKAAGSEHNATKKSHSSKKPSSTPISKSADDIMVFRKELDALALKHLGPVPTKTPTSTNPVNTGGGNVNTGNEQVSPGHIEAVSPSAHNVGRGLL